MYNLIEVWLPAVGRRRHQPRHMITFFLHTLIVRIFISSGDEHK